MSSTLRVSTSLLFLLLSHCQALPSDIVSSNNHAEQKDPRPNKFTAEVAYEETARTLAKIPTSEDVVRDSLPGYDGCPEEGDRPECVDLAHALGALTGLFEPSYGKVLMPVPSLSRLVEMCDVWDTVVSVANIDPDQCCHLDHHCHQMRRNNKRNLRRNIL